MAETTRFAPSPSGHLHLGHAYAAWFAAQAGGIFHVRVEDLDRQRCRPEFEAAIFEDLGWLGFTWEQPVMRQSDRAPAYAAALAELQAQNLLYPCFCPRKRVGPSPVGAPHAGEVHVYDGLCRALPPAEVQAKLAESIPHTLRLHATEALRRTGPLRWHDEKLGWQRVDSTVMGDVLLARKDAACAYHLAVVVDDAAQGVTLVTRGEDLRDATHTHRLLQALLGLPEPRWSHHRLLTDPTGRRLAKRDHATELRALRASGHKPEDILSGFTRLPS